MNSPRLYSPAKRPLQAFTLIELLTVIAIIGILAALIIPTVGKVRNSARSAKTISNAKQVGVAMLLYSQENRNAILAHSYNPGFSTSEATFRQFAAYLIRNPNGSGGAAVVKDRTNQTLLNVCDAAIPESLIQKSDAAGGPYSSYKFTWSINTIFNYNAGRQVQGVGAYSNAVGGSPRTVNEFLEPSRTLYALSGKGYEFATQIANQAYTNPDGETLHPIGYFHRGGKAAAAVFLDGHTALLDFPIDPKLTLNKVYN